MGDRTTELGILSVMNGLTKGLVNGLKMKQQRQRLDIEDNYKKAVIDIKKD